MSDPQNEQAAEIAETNAQLAVRIHAAEAALNPDPGDLREAAWAVMGFIDGKAAEGPKASDPQAVGEVVDNVVSAVGGFYARDEQLGGTTTEGLFGSHPGDEAVIAALISAHGAQKMVEDKDPSKTSRLHNSEETRLRIEQLELHRSVDTGEFKARGDRALRHQAIDTLRDATRSIDSDPDSLPYLLEVGSKASAAVVELSDIAARTELETKSIGIRKAPLYRDYITRHMSQALEMTAPAAAVS
ncbi:MAG TPA: hypothetical protein VIH90_04775 [Candidatus Saccharimonadales bacterium]